MNNVETAKVALDIGVLIFSGVATWNNMKLRAEIAKLKLWIIQNFHAKPRANFLGDDMNQ